MARLDEVIETLDVPAHGDAIAAFSKRIDRQVALLAAAVGDFAAADGPQREGALSVKSWLIHGAGLDRFTAGRMAARAAKLRRLPILGEAFMAGAVGSGAVDTILGHVPDRHVERFADHEAELVPTLVGLERRDLAAVMQTWLARADALDPGPAPPERQDTVYLSPTSGNRAIL